MTGSPSPAEDFISCYDGCMTGCGRRHGSFEVCITLCMDRCTPPDGEGDSREEWTFIFACLTIIGLLFGTMLLFFLGKIINKAISGKHA
ncbi:unnamed protein product [Linum trigynum]|uniref:Uncharacterized protein n=1 Tax=Linum trigynum TaxID=586398 RepID=A0AAV2G1T3_9ROSI